MSKKIKIALITTWYPPNMSVATNRMQSFVEYLSPDYDIDVYTLGKERKNIQESKQVNVYYFPSSKILELFKNKQSDSALLHKIKTLINILLSFFIKNPLKKWEKAVTNSLIKQHQHENYNLILSSYAPIEAHQVALNICKQFKSVKWIADMRDEMSKNPNFNYKQLAVLKALEQEINQHAHAILSVSLPILDDFKILCPKISYFEEVRNGFNHHFERKKEATKNEHFSIGYFGTFYGQIKPDVFFDALLSLQNQIDLSTIKLNFYGVHHNFDIPSLLRNNLSIFAKLTYNDAIEKMSEMDVNLLINPITTRKGVYTGKLFDYISVQKPILAIVDPNDVAAKLIHEFEAGYVASFEDSQAIQQGILDAYHDWQKNVIKFASEEQKNSLHRKYQVEKIKLLIEKLTR